MYCYHCGKKINEHKLEMKHSSLQIVQEMEIEEGSEIHYICPRCGHEMHNGMSYEDSKELSRASHAQVQRGSNSFATGMCLNVLGAIILIVSIVFYLLSEKPTGDPGDRYLCGEWKVFIATLIISVILLGFGIAKTIIGIQKKVHYTKLLKDLNNKTFVQ